MKPEQTVEAAEQLVQEEAILVFGMRRSGTTWLAKIVDSHPDTLYRHEPDSWIRISGIPYYPPNVRNSVSSAAADQFYEEISRSSLPHIVAKAPFFGKSYFSIAQKYRQLGQALLSKTLKRVFGMNTGCFNAIPLLGGKKFRLVWKSVESPGRLAFLSAATPNSRSIFLIRHPCGYVNSYLRGQAIGKMPKTSEDSFNEDSWNWRLHTDTAKSYELSIDNVRSWSRKERMIWEWIIDNEFVLRSVRNREDIKVIIYDELCKSPNAIAREILEHCKLNWNAQTERFLDQGKRKKRSAYFSVFKDPAVTADAWRYQLTAADQQLVADTVKDTLPGRLFAGSFDLE